MFVTTVTKAIPEPQRRQIKSNMPIQMKKKPKLRRKDVRQVHVPEGVGAGQDEFGPFSTTVAGGHCFEDTFLGTAHISRVRVVACTLRTSACTQAGFHSVLKKLCPAENGSHVISWSSLHPHAFPRQFDGHSAPRRRRPRSEPRQYNTTEDPFRYFAECVWLSGRISSMSPTCTTRTTLCKVQQLFLRHHVPQSLFLQKAKI